MLDIRRLGFTALTLAIAVLHCHVVAIEATPQKPNRTYADEDYNFKMSAPENWQSANLASLSVPGEVRRAWTPDKVKTIVVFVQKPGSDVSPRLMLDQSVAGMKTSLGCEIQEQAVKDVGGMRAMWMVVTGKGTGGTIDGKGTTRTRQFWVAIPREMDVVVLLLTAPEAQFESASQVFRSMLKTLDIGGRQTAKQKAAK